MTTPQVGFDWRPLVDPVDPRETREFTRMLRAQGRVPSTNIAGIIAVVIVGGFGLLIGGGAFLAVIGGIIEAISGGGGGAGALAAAVPFVVFTVIAVVVITAIVRGSRNGNVRWLRLDRFARANGMSFVPSLPNPHLPGMIFNQGGSRESSDLVRGEQPRFVEFGNYRYVTGSGKSRTTHRWGYVAVKLDVPLPHIILDATGNNALFGSNLPMFFDRDQRLSLEGDFDRYFALFCPQGYERDALYLFTPDIMARFIDNAAQLDVEIVDDWMFLYAKRDLSTLDPATWGWLFSTVAALLDKMAQWARWRDDHLDSALAPSAGGAASGIPGAAPGVPAPLTTPPPGVAPAGRRLKGGVPWVAILVFGGIGLVWLFSVFGGWGVFASLLSR
ncbi:hypothetical protein [Microbacterium sp. P05]|uniref:hypothetical protein n=1 Tax=Microbacterium sp. P05 TaxID=3366948 RepID=UPI003746B786